MVRLEDKAGFSGIYDFWDAAAIRTDNGFAVGIGLKDGSGQRIVP